MGLIRDRRAIAAARRLEAFCEGRADRIVAVTEGIRDGLLQHGVPPGKVVLITNGVDLEVGNGSRPAALPVPDEAFVAMYVGAHGTYSSLETLLDAAADLRDAPEVRLVLVGNGDRKPALVESARRRGLDNVAFVDPVPKREVPSWLARADACVLPYQDNPLFAGALPNKAFDYLGAPDRRLGPRGGVDPDGRARGLRRGGAARGRPRAGRRDPGDGRRPRGRAADGGARPPLRPGPLRPRGAGRPLRGDGGVPCLTARRAPSGRSAGAPSGPPTSRSPSRWRS
jgi:hypothetical protein